jgi:hypothetical protein
MKHTQLVLLIIAFVLAATSSGREPAQQLKVAFPMISAAGVPLYPFQAYISNIQGVVHLMVTTDGHRVVDARVKDGHKLLASAAEENVRTWQFHLHDPTTFQVTYTYKLVTDLNP